MIGKSLRERHAPEALAPGRAVALLSEAMGSHAEHLVQVRAQGPRMIACLVVRADAASVRLCRTLGIEIRPGGTGVFGLLGEDAARLLGSLPAERRTWIETPSGPRETKVLLVAGGVALLSLETTNGKVAITVVP